jgi:lipid-A-disaccharide synthase
MKTVVIIAGEVSGDMHAAKLVRAIRLRDPAVRFAGIGGDEMRAAGVEVLYHVRDMAVLGLWAVLRRFAFFRRVFMAMLDLVRSTKPDAVILVDYPGFNLRFAARVHAMGTRVLYYICPQVWAWNRSRIPKMAGTIDRLITIFPFEAAHFAGTGLPVDFVGHPLVDEARAAMGEPPAALPWKGEPRIALLPGSRHQEIHRLLPRMWSAARLVETAHPDASFIVATPSPAVEEYVRCQIARQPDGPSRWEVVPGKTRQVLRQARAAMVASGTATIEASLMLCPMVVTYRVLPLTYAAMRRLVKVPHIGMVNIVAGKEICPERIQGRATAQELAEAIEPVLSDARAREAAVGELRRVSAALGPGGASERAADIVLAAIGLKTQPVRPC